MPSNDKPRMIAPPESQSHNGMVHASPQTVGDESLGPPALSSAPTVTSLWQAFRRRWLLATSLAIVGAAAAVFAVIQLFPAQYHASVRIQIKPHPAQPLISNAVTDQTDFVIYKANLAALVKSPQVVGNAIESLKDQGIVMHPSDVGWLEKTIKTDFKLAPDMMKVSLAGEEPEKIAKLLNAIAESFVKEVRSREQMDRQMRLDELKKNFRRIEEKLHEKRVRLRTMEHAAGVEDRAKLQSQHQTALNDLTDAKRRLRDVRLQSIEERQKLRALNARADSIDISKIPRVLLEEGLRKDPRAQSFFTELAKISKDIQQITQTSVGGENSPLVAKEKAKEDRIKRALNRLRAELKPELEKLVRDKIRAEVSSKIRQTNDRLDVLEQKQNALTVEIDELEKMTKRLNPANQPRPEHIVALEREIENTEQSLKKLSQSITALKVEFGDEDNPRRQAQLSRVGIQLRAAPPQEKDHSRQFKIGTVAGIGMFGMLLLGISWWEFRSRKVNAADDVHGLGLNLVGTLPSLPDRARNAVPGKTSPRIASLQNQLAESIDSIRTMLLHSARTESLRVVMVSSAVQGEGKTSLASQLAASLARAWRKTLLVDGDLRAPDIHKLFHVPQEPGLSELLRGEVNLQDAIRPTSLGRLWVMPAGHWDSHAVEALAQERVASMFEQLEEDYDFIIVDSSPVLPVADALNLAQNVDAVIFSVLRDVSRTPALFAAQQRLASLGVRILGGVVIGEQAAGGVAYQYAAANPR